MELDEAEAADEALDLVDSAGSSVVRRVCDVLDNARARRSQAQVPVGHESAQGGVGGVDVRQVPGQFAGMTADGVGVGARTIAQDVVLIDEVGQREEHVSSRTGRR
ncbi:hypothetical protein [Tersicoccus sp. Bi-70]|uniref:hypothetical protein n=1 Tax=Tersicoccus sp. Bi-70 TaxID=1897634 RepID=UPI001E3FB46F|nr:hypothetical protein [Tersicoccus sp. Bi-70]